MPPTPTDDENKHNPGILLISGLVHSFIQGIIVSQVGRYYEDYYHLDTLTMKAYVGIIVVISLYVCHRKHPSRSLVTHCGRLKRADNVYQLQSLGGHPSTRRSEPHGSRCSLPLIPTFLTGSVDTLESFDVGGSIFEWRPLCLVSYLPHQTVLESKRSIVVKHHD